MISLIYFMFFLCWITLSKEKNCSSGPQLTVEQLKRIEQKRHEAMRRLAARNDPMPIGESWSIHIGTEFGKPYFTEVYDNTHSTFTFKVMSRCTVMSHSVKTLVCNGFSSLADVFCHWGEETFHCLSKQRASLLLDTRVCIWGCKFFNE